jgi:hypothetical protein
MCACDGMTEKNSLTPANPADSVLLNLYGNTRKFENYQVVIIDECEYIAYKSNNTQFLSIEHKGNCKNPIHYQVKHDTIFLWKEGNLTLQRKSTANDTKR